MGVNITWWFYKVEETDFALVKSEFDQAAEGIPSLPKVPPLAPQGIFAGSDLSSSLYHEPFSLLAHRIVEEEFPLSLESILIDEIVMRSRVAPPAILLIGIGSERFSQLPGYLGNMLIHSSEVEQTIESVSRILDVEWKTYFEKTKLVLDYVGDDDRAAKDVADPLHALPRALKTIKNEGASLLALTTWE